jgi:hypothetical protein
MTMRTARKLRKNLRQLKQDNYVIPIEHIEIPVKWETVEGIKH